MQQSPFTVIVSQRGREVQRLDFSSDEISVGRVQGNQIVLPKGNVSKRHARILRREDRFIVTDLQSTNGTYLNRRRIDQATIVRSGDKIYVGDFVLQILDDYEKDSSEKGGASSALPDLENRQGLAAKGSDSSAPFSVPTVTVPDSMRISTRDVVEQFSASASPSAEGSSDSSSPFSAPPGSLRDAPPVDSSGVAYTQRPSSSPAASTASPAASSVPVRGGRALSSSTAPHSSGAPPRYSDSANYPEGSNASQRISDLARAQRLLVAQLIQEVLDEHGEPGLFPAEEKKAEHREHVLALVEDLMIEGRVPVGTDAETVANQALSELHGWGPLSELIEDPAVTSISAPSFDSLFGTRDARQQSFPPGFSSEQSFEWALKRICKKSGTQWPESGMIEGELEDGVHFNALVGGIASSGPLFHLRKPREIRSSLDELVRRGVLSRAIATFLTQCVNSRLNILIAGPYDEGAHNLLSALVASSRERVIAASDFDDITGGDEGAVRLRLDRGSRKVRKIFEMVSTIPQSRLAVTLSTPEVALATVEAVGGGASGVMASVRAANLERGLLRLPADIASLRSGIGLESATGWVLSAFDVAVEVARLQDGRIRVLRVAELSRNEIGTITAHDIFRFSVSRVAAGGAVEGSFLALGHVPRVATRMQALGQKVEPELFQVTGSRPENR
ncbi:MAG: FHA domain-containing protein [Polyangiaceae bacterium]|nr:FHA domain-containing protein [Polyangiaceae bacterium]